MTNYIGMRLDNFEVIGFSVNDITKEIDIKIQCTKCGHTVNSSINPKKCTRILCKNCGGLKYIVVTSISKLSGLPLNFIIVSDYKYRKIRQQYIKDGQAISWVNYIANYYIQYGI